LATAVAAHHRQSDRAAHRSPWQRRSV